ncbi:MAG: GNAT family N-acetyltransferase [Spirochaetales bacterium]|nr:GNAT family N-acetyltransferase [Spirochaetales bacterium]
MSNNKKHSIQCDVRDDISKEIIYSSVLKDKTRICFYFLDHGCKDCITEGFDLLSSSSKRYRFNFSFKQFSKQELEYLTHIDNKNHVAIVSRFLDSTTEYPGMGIGRYIRLPKKPDTAEIAITVLDKYQNMSLGTLLFCLLARYALHNNISKFGGYIQKDNHAMLRLFNKFNSTAVSQGSSLCYLEIDLHTCKQKIFDILKQQQLEKI